MQHLRSTMSCPAPQLLHIGRPATLLISTPRSSAPVLKPQRHQVCSSFAITGRDAVERVNERDRQVVCWFWQNEAVAIGCRLRLDKQTAAGTHRPSSICRERLRAKGSAVIDLFSRQVVGWSMREHTQASMVADALRMAWFRRRPVPGLIFHSDCGRPVLQQRLPRCAQGLPDEIGNEPQG